jgi:UDP-N-acetylglucosamine--N-acetylmuramyl-(pentapeptide) pyrophosphoryl-undecaprenol N-acetylglucosamine transferase
MLKALRRSGRAARGQAAVPRTPPDAVIGFGGYPAFPALLAAASLDIPTVLHEQNAVLGRVNRLLAGNAKRSPRLTSGSTG